MIDVASVLKAMPSFDRFCSVNELLALADTLRADSNKFEVQVAGKSSNGVPIHHIRFGKGSVKALFVGFPHPNEPIGGLTVSSLIKLLQQGNSALIGADVEWHIVPCIDPDGAILNEGWSQEVFTLGNYMRNFHRQEPLDQVECSFPIRHKQLAFDQPTAEAKVLKGLLDRIRPDFFYSLHNAWAGGAFYCLNRDIGKKYYRQLYQLLDDHQVPLQPNPPYREWSAEFSEGVTEIFSMKRFYDFLEKTMAHPETVLKSGACSWEYLAEIKESAVTFLGEFSYVKHPSDGSKQPTQQSLRQASLRADADAKYVATAILEEWEKVKEDVNRDSAFYGKIFKGLISVKENLAEGLPSWPFKTRDILFNPAYSRNMTEGERFNVHLMHRFWLLCHSYEFVRLLQASAQTAAVQQAITRLEPIFAAALAEIESSVGAEQFEIVDCNSLVRLQLGSGLIVLNSVLEKLPT